jgi:hypothetical protein
MARLQKTYDHRLRDLVRRTGDLTVTTNAGVPRSTAAGWIRGPNRATVTLDVLGMNEQDLQAEVVRLRRHVEKLRGVRHRGATSTTTRRAAICGPDAA